jgi:hypothetical protein
VKDSTFQAEWNDLTGKSGSTFFLEYAKQLGIEVGIEGSNPNENSNPQQPTSYLPRFLLVGKVSNCPAFLGGEGKFVVF